MESQVTRAPSLGDCGQTSDLAPCSGRPLRVCVLGLGGGGFHMESQRIINGVRRPLELVLVFAGPAGGIRRWESYHPVKSVYLLRSPALIGDRFWHKLYHGVVNLKRAFQILIADQPDVILAVGTAQALPFGLAGRCLGQPLWFVESCTRVHGPSRTGTWLHRLRLATQFFYAWPTLARHYSRATYDSEAI